MSKKITKAPVKVTKTNRPLATKPKALTSVADQVQIAIAELNQPGEVATGPRDAHGRLLSISGIPQFLRDAALAKPLIDMDKVRAQNTGTKREWFMPGKDLPKARTMADIMAHYEVSDPNAPVSVQVALSDKAGSSALASYDNWADFKAKHDVSAYPIKKTATLDGMTVVIVRATPWANKPKYEKKERTGKSKKEIIGEMLLRPEGCTSKEVCEAMEWPAVSMPAQCKAAGLKLRKEKVDGVTRYWGSK